MKRFVLTERAEQDVKDIRAFIARDNRKVADRVVREIRAANRTLVKMPLIGHEHPLLPSDALRVWPVYSYLIIYAPATKPLQIIRILHGSRELRRLLGFGEGD